MKTKDLQTNLRNIFLPFHAHLLCFQWRADLTGLCVLGWTHLDMMILSLLPPPQWKACCAPSCSEPESGSIRDHTKILKSSEFWVQGKGSAIDTKSLTQKPPCYNVCLVCFPSEQSRIFAPDFTGKIGIWNERWHNVLPRSITVSCLELVDNSWQVIYIALLLILPFISSVVNLLEVLLIRVVFANHMVYLY